jgi:hypothetical protein
MLTTHICVNLVTLSNITYYEIKSIGKMWRKDTTENRKDVKRPTEFLEFIGLIGFFGL